jgi:uncharacterized protein
MARKEGTNTFAQVTMWLAIIGAVNWGLVGFFNFDLVRAILGNESTTDASALARTVYALVGLSGVGLAIVAPRLRAKETARAPLGREVEARQHL